MEINELDLNKLKSLEKRRNPLVIRIHINNFDKTNPLQKIYIKEKKTVKSKSKSKSKVKKRTSSVKLFANAHIAAEN